MATRPNNLGFNSLGCIVLPAALFVGLMISTAGMAIYPPVTAVANPLICSGEVEYELQSYSYRPGQSGVQRFIYCRTGGPKGSREEITWSAVGVSFLIYSAIFFLIFGFVVRPLLRRRYERTIEAVRTSQAMAGLGTGAAAGGVQDIFARVSEAVKKGEARVVVHEDSAGGEETSDLAERLAQLKALRDQGLITADDYELKKAELLSQL